MQLDPSTRRGVQLVAIASLPILVIGAFGGWMLHSARAPSDRGEIEKVVRETILAHPEILPEAMENLRARENGKRIGAIRGELERPFPGAVIGNPQGTVTLVEFTDFACGYCRQSVADVDDLVRRNPDLKVVVREFPILSPNSALAARMGLAAAEQGKYPAFHRLMFAAGRPDPATIDAAAKQAGLDMARARKVADSPRVAMELRRNMEMAQTLGFEGTPSWVIGDELLSGAVGIDRLAEAIAARKD